MGLVVPVKGINLTGDKKTQEAQVARPADVCVDHRSEDLCDPGTLDQLAGHIELRTRGRSAAAGVKGRAH
jgi:hypothetical protein